MTRAEIVAENQELTAEVERLHAEIEALQSGKSDEVEKLKTALIDTRLALVNERRRQVAAEPAKPTKGKDVWSQYNALEGAERTAFWRENKAALQAEVGRV